MEPTDKKLVVRVLRETAQYLRLKGENFFKCQAYETGAERIAGVAEPLEQLVESGRLLELPGIGSTLAAQIAELVHTGRLEFYEKLRSEFPPGILELLAVEGLGPKKVAALHQALGITDLASLEAACREGRVHEVPGYGKKTEQKLLEAILRLRKAQGSGRRLWAEVEPIANELLEFVRKLPGVSRVSLAGSARRACETVADLDLVVAAEDPGPVFSGFGAHPRVEEVLGRGETACSVRLDTGLQVDMRVLPEEDFATALHHFTGSKAHHVRLRGLAQSKGMTISEWGLHRLSNGSPGEKLPVRDEAELYGHLGMQYIPPELREDWGEIEAALEGRLPKDLITLEDLQGAVHSHSTWSDGRSTLEQMALSAKALGLRYLTVTEHSQTAAYAGGLKEGDLERQWDEIDALNERLGEFRLLKGIESDILEDGSLDYPEQLLRRLDVVIGSVHQRHGQNEDQMTRRILTAFDNPRLRIWGHPTGRLILKREPAPMLLEPILEKAAAVGIAVEVNGSPERLDLKGEHVRMALARGVRLVVSVDAHHESELFRNLAFAVATARKGWARRGDVLNTLPLPAFVAALESSP